MNYYNENEPFVAAWLRELIKAKLIGNGEVDERSIEDVEASELRGFRQCHFFAGIGVWSLALRNAGWGDDRSVWTGSCPCQSFSAAGQRKGFADKRHLWPAWFRLISVAHPQRLLGEQVASKDALAWLDLVSSDLEGAGYTIGAVDTCAAGFGAPHIRQRLYWVADSAESRRKAAREHDGGPSSFSSRLEQCSGDGELAYSHATRPQGRIVSGAVGEWGGEGELIVRPSSLDGFLADSNGRKPRNRDLQRSGEYGLRKENGGVGCALVDSSSEQERIPRFTRESRGTDDGMAHAESQRDRSRDAGTRGRSESADGGGMGLPDNDGRQPRDSASETTRQGNPSLPTSFWSECSWLPCIDGKTRPVEPGTFPLAHGIANRVGTLRGYGNALVAPQAEEFVRAVMEILG